MKRVVQINQGDFDEVASGMIDAAQMEVETIVEETGILLYDIGRNRKESAPFEKVLYFL